MSKKKKNAPRTLEVPISNGDCKKEKVTERLLTPSINAALAIADRHDGSELINVNTINEELHKQSKQIRDGDMGRVEDMLISQAHTLDNLFNELILRSRFNMGEYFNAAHKYMNIAFKAQSQCRSTLEALAEIKNPKPYIQNNRAQYQQVNNDGKPSRARGKSNNRNELLEDKRNETQWLDTRAPETAGGTDKELEAVGAKHRPED